MTRTIRILYPIFGLGILAAVAWMTVALISPPNPRPVSSPATHFSAERAMEDLAIIASEPHPMGVSQAHADARDYLLDEIRSLGLEPQVQKTIGVREVAPGDVIAGTVENILLLLPGSDPAGAIALMSHYDTAPDVPGAVDSTSGVVTVLELLRALQASPPLRQDVLFVFTDGEEPGTIGAHALVDQHPWFEDIRFAINMDQFSLGPPVLVRSSQGNGAVVQAIARSAARPAFVSLPYHLFPGGETDLLPFTMAGVPGADIQTTFHHQEIHTVLDRPEIVNPASLQQAGDQLLGMVRTLGDQPTLDKSAPDRSFFPMLGKLIHYPTSWAIPLAIVAGLTFVGVLAYGFRRSRLSWFGMGLGFLTFLLSLCLSVGITNLIWLGVQAPHPEYAYSPIRVHLSDDPLYTIGFIFVALALTSFTVAMARKKIAAHDLAAGGLLFWLFTAIVVAVMIPATSYLASWLLLTGSLALSLSLYAEFKRGALALSGLGLLASVIVATFLWVPVIYVSVFGSGLPLLSMIIGLTALWLGSIMPFLDWISASNRWVLPAAALLCGAGFLVAGHYLVGKGSPSAPVNPMGYWLDVDEDEAYWIGFSEDLDQRQAKILVDARQQPYTDIFPSAPAYSVLTKKAPKLDLTGPDIEIVDDYWTGDHRVTRVRITTSMHDRLYVIVPKDVNMLALKLPHNERRSVQPCDHDFVLRFDGMPLDDLEMEFEVDTSEPYQVFLVEERTGLPAFPGLSTKPEPGTMETPGEFEQTIPTDFTAVKKDFLIPEPGS